MSENITSQPEIVPNGNMIVMREKLDALLKTQQDIEPFVELYKEHQLLKIRHEPTWDALASNVEIDKQAKVVGDYIAGKIKDSARHLAIQNNFAEIRIRDRRQIGKVWPDVPKNKGTQGQLIGPGVIGPISEIGPIDIPTLADIGSSAAEMQKCKWIAALPDDKFEEHIAQYQEEGWELTCAGIERHGRAYLRQDQETPPLPDGKFRVIYADPPWDYQFSNSPISANDQYPTMSTKKIEELDVKALANPDSVLFMWATSPMLPDALSVIKAWGATYKASIVWDKGKAPPIGWFVSTRHEFLLIATWEENTHPDTQPDSIYSEPSTDHSRKPIHFYDMIESMYTGPYIELFARQPHKNWKAWGNENVS